MIDEACPDTKSATPLKEMKSSPAKYLGNVGGFSNVDLWIRFFKFLQINISIYKYQLKRQVKK